MTKPYTRTEFDSKHYRSLDKDRIRATVAHGWRNENPTEEELTVWAARLVDPLAVKWFAPCDNLTDALMVAREFDYVVTMLLRKDGSLTISVGGDTVYDGPASTDAALALTRHYYQLDQKMGAAA